MTLEILYQFNEKYAPYAGISITSLFENNKDADDIIVYILDDEVSPISKARLFETAADYNRKIKFLDSRGIINTMIELGIPKYRGSYTTNLKLFLPMIMKGSVDKLLYIDSDTLVTGSLSKLFEIDTEGKPVAMALDSLGEKHKLLIGLDDVDNYYNAGVILFNLNEWKKQMCTERITEHVQNRRAHYMSPDQDLLNVVLKDNIFLIGPEYNLQPIHLEYSFDTFKGFFGQKNYYEKEVVEAAVEAPKILHFFRFLGQFPWDENSVHPDKEIFDEYMQKSRWSDYEKVPSDNTGFTFKIERWLYKVCPSWLFLLLFKMNYDKFIKQAEKDSRKNQNNDNM